jgi:hypothetical protein
MKKLGSYVLSTPYQKRANDMRKKRAANANASLGSLDRANDGWIDSGLDRSVRHSCAPGPRSQPKISVSPTTYKVLTQPPKTC